MMDAADLLLALAFLAIMFAVVEFSTGSID